LLQHKKRVAFTNRIISLFHLHFHLFLPCCVGGILTRAFLYRHQGVNKTLWTLFQEPVTKEISLQSKFYFIMTPLKKIAMKEILVHSCVVFMSFSLTFFLNQIYLTKCFYYLKQLF
jgi:hypothetical protein